MKLRSVLLASAVLVSLPVVASAEPGESWYLGVGVGGNWLDDIQTTLRGPGGGITPDAYQADFDTGWAAAGTIGYHWENVRLELELGYRSNDTSGVGINIAPPGPLTPQPGLSGDVTQFSQMLNLVFDIPLGDDFALELGGGIGGAMVDVDISGALAGGGTQSLSDDDYVIAYQAIAGLSWDIGDNMEVFGEYRYFTANEVDVVGLNTGGVFPGVIDPDDFDLESHTGLVGLRFFFGEEMEEAAPAPAPAPTTDFSLYFTKKDVLTAEGQTTLQEAADAHKGGADIVTVHVEGGGPRAGEVVTRALVDLGVAADKISVSPDGTTVTITK